MDTVLFWVKPPKQEKPAPSPKPEPAPEHPVRSRKPRLVIGAVEIFLVLVGMVLLLGWLLQAATAETVFQQLGGLVSGTMGCLMFGIAGIASLIRTVANRVEDRLFILEEHGSSSRELLKRIEIAIQNTQVTDNLKR